MSIELLIAIKLEALYSLFRSMGEDRQEFMAMGVGDWIALEILAYRLQPYERLVYVD